MYCIKADRLIQRVTKKQSIDKYVCERCIIPLAVLAGSETANSKMTRTLARKRIKYGLIH